MRLITNTRTRTVTNGRIIVKDRGYRVLERAIYTGRTHCLWDKR